MLMTFDLSKEFFRQSVNFIDTHKAFQTTVCKHDSNVLFLTVVGITKLCRNEKTKMFIFFIYTFFV